MNTIVFCWVDLAAVSLLDELFPPWGGRRCSMAGGFPRHPAQWAMLALAVILWVQLPNGEAEVVLRSCVPWGWRCALDPAVYASDEGWTSTLRLGLPLAGVLRGRVGDGVTTPGPAAASGSRPHHLRSW